jgi:hypothetical protein
VGAGVTQAAGPRRSNFASFREFYPYYLQQHTNTVSRRLHVCGTLAALLCVLAALLTARWLLLPLALVIGYGPAWIGDFVFERNSPATFGNPLYSLRGDFTMLAEVLTGRRRF